MSKEKDFSIVSAREWRSEWDDAAFKLAEGYTVKEAAEAAGVTERTIYNWKKNEIFAQEVDRMSLIMGLASKAERSRILMQMARQKYDKEKDEWILDDTSLMDIIKEMRMMKEGTILDFTKIYAAVAEEARSVARSGPEIIDSQDETEEHES